MSSVIPVRLVFLFLGGQPLRHVFFLLMLRALLGLDGIDHLGLGGALWPTGTIFRFGVHTWHCRRCVNAKYRLCTCGTYGWLARIWTICAHVWDHGTTACSESRAAVTSGCVRKQARQTIIASGSAHLYLWDRNTKLDLLSLLV